MKWLLAAKHLQLKQHSKSVAVPSQKTAGRIWAYPLGGTML